MSVCKGYLSRMINKNHTPKGLSPPQEAQTLSLHTFFMRAQGPGPASASFEGNRTEQADDASRRNETAGSGPSVNLRTLMNNTGNTCYVKSVL